ncbi:hypothetical protein EW146_g5136 [Bondarzewia mesenterica]|uniref:Uncharacterized protein n=1 Tax=Bondarzewia mesenterica TaxID=1095465 RepID=A0A4S4LY51_9AGAM|nr:hypothetical protein EW146_g5136 [Bondarzewia mesenterica]
MPSKCLRKVIHHHSDHINFAPPAWLSPFPTRLSISWGGRATLAHYADNQHRTMSHETPPSDPEQANDHCKRTSLRAVAAFHIRKRANVAEQRNFRLSGL